MNTVEMTCVTALTLGVICLLITFSINLHGTVRSHQDQAMSAEVSSHTEGQRKEQFQPELFIRSLTIAESAPESEGSK